MGRVWGEVKGRVLDLAVSSACAIIDRERSLLRVLVMCLE